MILPSFPIRHSFEWTSLLWSAYRDAGLAGWGPGMVTSSHGSIKQLLFPIPWENGLDCSQTVAEQHVKTSSEKNNVEDNCYKDYGYKTKSDKKNDHDLLYEGIWK